MSNYIKKEPITRYSEKCGRVMHTDGKRTTIFWNVDMIDTLKRYFSTTLNDELSGMIGVSPRTMIRKARELGLEKNKVWLYNVWNERRKWAQIASRRKGYPGTFKPGCEIGKEYRFKKKESSSECSID